ncbi:alanine and arginine-rich domain-containing protein [Acipenser oxyrinchus oxyrinchus]|uniref:Alanine and arginine-rich domain-containing protein n=1 Tax=Acipenser oxyrinchus oxyrinchus TaxID=40147 RepID=A0AAD8GFL0_ACIOX|nr:alanine and arginine-rich domain-containing protein [Acipenser oxyrinchus oxyrinchus]
MNSETQYEDSVSTLMLENIKNKLINAFRESGQHAAASCSTNDSCNLVAKDIQANEELRRAKIDGAITWLRTELLEMRSQDRHLAKTLLDLNTEIQRLRQENESSPDKKPIAVTNNNDLETPFHGSETVEDPSLIQMN